MTSRRAAAPVHRHYMARFCFFSSELRFFRVGMVAFVFTYLHHIARYVNGFFHLGLTSIPVPFLLTTADCRSGAVF